MKKDNKLSLRNIIKPLSRDTLANTRGGGFSFRVGGECRSLFNFYVCTHDGSTNHGAWDNFSDCEALCAE